MRLVIFFVAAFAVLAQKYSGPVPEKEDLLYLVQADNLIPTEATTAKELKGKKDLSTFIVPGAASSARTPLASPIFLLKAKDLEPNKLELYRLEVNHGRREITMRTGKNARNSPPLRVDVKRLDEGLFRLEVGESLPKGEYSFTPPDSNDVFCFEVY